MREILFIGKQVDNGEWVEGYYFGHWEKAYILWGTTNNVPHMIEVDPNTVSQYTGLNDKNGTKIFEGDIVRYSDTIHEVAFERKNGTAYFGIVMSEIETWDFSNSVPSSEMEVIGNIYDNPELLKGATQ